MGNRTARVERVTKETQVLVELDLDGTGTTEVETGVPFFDHMLAQLGKHGCIDLVVRTNGDTEIDAHHTVEDTALALGQALREALGDKAGITRFGDALVPLDETLVQNLGERLADRPAVELASGKQVLIPRIDEVEHVLRAAQYANDRRRLHEERVKRRPRDEGIDVSSARSETGSF